MARLRGAGRCRGPVRRRARARWRAGRIAASEIDDESPEIRTDHGGQVDFVRVDDHQVDDDHHPRGVECHGRAGVHRCPDDDRRDDVDHNGDSSGRDDDDCLDRSASCSSADDATAVAVYDGRRGHLDDACDDDNDRAVSSDDLVTPSRNPSGVDQLARRRCKNASMKCGLWSQ